jgi:hypothetical protein
MKKAVFILGLFLSLAGFADAQESEEVEDTGDLDLWNPFFLPYAGDVQIDLASGFKTNKQNIGIASGAGSLVKKDDQVFTSVSAKYGIFDRLALGVEASYMMRQDYSETWGGALSSNPNITSANSGFYDIGFFVDFRLLGKYREKWYANLELEFRPGYRDSNNFLFSYPNNLYIFAGALGKNVGRWTFGALVLVKYFQESAYDTNNNKNKEIQGISQLFCQVDIGPLYVKGAGGVFKLLDEKSASDPVRKKTFPAAALEFGFPVSDQAVLKANLQWVGTVSGETASNGTQFSISAGPFINANVGLTLLY